MYKDKNKQKEANKKASKKYRQGMTVTPCVIPEKPVIPLAMTPEDVVRGKPMKDWTKAETRACLDYWQTNGTPYQKALVGLGQHYTRFSTGYPQCQQL